ncbi:MULTISPECIES: flagellar assembly peptidoglycan hydrolase FlgJ [unclassified Thioalkalivibrio]|uniref:flagellar assembly peptidoglycan hydrolase FlgJ n=1 Tax=unclassified Thioalkalivibrio TaxID=2621013 RepID=UPI00037EA4B9|nr:MULTISPECIES: flagellar assembly peptidoglycan hydrolase FlgJ [unclassified Thioalkalivibrio]
MISSGHDLSMQARSALASDPSGLRDLGRAAQGGGDEALEAVAREFEAMLIGQMLKQMREASLGDGLFDNEQSKMYLEMQDQEFAKAMSQGDGIGLREVLMQQLSQQSQPQDGQGLRDPERLASLDLPQRRGDLNFRRLSDEQRELEPVAPVRPAQSDTGAGAGELQRLGGAPSPLAIDWPPRDPSEFVATLEPLAREAAADLGVEPGILLAQSALETGWGRHVPSRENGQPSFNLFGIKADSRWEGDQVAVGTLEYRDGVAQREQARFRAYADPADSFADYVDFIRNNPRYHRALQAGDDVQYIRELQAAGYATDPAYADKVLRVRDQLSGYVNPEPTQALAEPAVTRNEG